MTTPISDFVRGYAAAEAIRFHMPGHKGKSPQSERDITEIDGADILYDSGGIIRESEENAAGLFGSARTVYSAEGSSLCIRAMLYLVKMGAAMCGQRAKIAAGRNAHRVFLEAAALLDLDVDWLGTGGSLLQSLIVPEEVEALFSGADSAPDAVYLTSPDYLGTCADLQGIAEICHRYGALFLVDNAHGAYLKFLKQPRHPLDCGADLCCDSAHKTLPVLTGGAYLHASKACPAALLPMMERAMALFASTSPSWLILQSLDEANALLAGDYPERIQRTAEQLSRVREKLHDDGWVLAGDEPLKLTLCPKGRGYTGTQLANSLRERGIACEFADPDYSVLMITPENTEDEMERLVYSLKTLPVRPAIETRPPRPGKPHPLLSPHEVLFRPFERIPTERSLGRILAAPGVSCPPAVPIAVCGERIDETALRLFRYYGIEAVDVVSNE